MSAAMIDAKAVVQRLAAVWRAGEIKDVQQHPDLAELDAQLNGFYDPPPGSRQNGEPR